MTPEAFAAWDGRSSELPDLLDVDVVLEVPDVASLAEFTFPEGTAYELLTMAPVGATDAYRFVNVLMDAQPYGEVTVTNGPTGKLALRSVYWKPAKKLTADAILWNRTTKGADGRATEISERQPI